MIDYSLINNINYDLIMFTRPDLFHYNNLIFKQLNDDYIVHTYENYEHGTPSDICFYGNKNTMNRLIKSFTVENGLCPHSKLKPYRLIVDTIVDIVRKINNLDNNKKELEFIKESEINIFKSFPKIII
jgi:hypothetical protein